MRIYRISLEKGQKEKTDSLRRSAIITATSVLIGFAVGARSLLQLKDQRVVLVVICLLAGLFTWFIWRSLKKTRQFLSEAYSTFEIISDGETLTKKQKNTPDVTLDRAEITRVEEAQGKGFRICTAQRTRNIWVPCEVEGYEALRAELAGLPGVALTSRTKAWLKTYVVLGLFFLVFAVTILVKDPIIAAGTSVLLAAYLLFSSARHYKNPNLTNRARQLLRWNAFLGFCLLVRAYFLWRP